MEKDAIYYGTLIIFGAFFLMVTFFIYDVWKSSRMRKELEGIKTEQRVDVKDSSRDFSLYPTLTGDDGGKMVLVPLGPFQMGSPAGRGDFDETPRHAVFLPAFYIDLKEVTQAQFARFSDETGHPLPKVPFFEDDLKLILRAELPVMALSWNAARSYCEWAGKRLPTEAEWEKAAGGEENFKWPWGNEFDSRSANLLNEEDGFQYLAPPGQFNSGRSPYGLYDMAGNVAEWVADHYDPDYYEEAPFKQPRGPEGGKFRVYRGGSWNESSVNARTAKRFAAAPHQTSVVIGFRCAEDAPDQAGQTTVDIGI